MGIDLNLARIDVETAEWLRAVDLDEIDIDDIEPIEAVGERAAAVWSGSCEKAFDVTHYALTGGTVGDASVVYGVPLRFGAMADMTATLFPDEVRALAARLAGVNEEQVRERLASVPPDAYNADWADPGQRDDLLADALALRAFVQECADAGDALVLYLM